MTMIVTRQHRIFYRYEGDKGAYVMLHHGLLGSHRDWYDHGWVKALAEDFRLIIPDALGHGRSDRPADPAEYSVAALVEDLVALMDELNIRNMHFLGYSLGALVGFELLMRHPERMRITMLSGEAPFISTASREHWRQMAEDLGGRSYEDFFAHAREKHLVLPGAPDNGRCETSAEAHAGAAALLQALQDEPERPDEGRLNFDSPVALYTAEKDPAAIRIKDARRRIHRARLVSLSGLDHVQMFVQREALLGEVLRLLRSGRKTEGDQDDLSDHDHDSTAAQDAQPRPQQDRASHAPARPDDEDKRPPSVDADGSPASPALEVRADATEDRERDGDGDDAAGWEAEALAAQENDAEEAWPSDDDGEQGLLS